MQEIERPLARDQIPVQSPPSRRPARHGVTEGAAAAVAYVAAIFITAMDTHIVNVALPTLSRTFGASISAVQWTVIGYVLTLALVIPASGWITDRIGMKRAFIIALAIFTLASALCGLAQSLGELIAARAIQGVGGGILTPVGTAMLFRAFGPAERARAVRLLIVPILLAPATAPVVGGALTQYVSWRWVFYVNVPIGLGTLIFASLYLREQRERDGSRLDVLGLALSGVGLSSLMYAISEGGVEGWGSAPILGTAVAGILALGLFVRTQLSHADPLLRLRLLGDRLFRATNVVVAFGSGAFLGSLYLTPIFLQAVHHQSPLGSGSTTFVEAIGVACASQTLGRLYPRVGPRVMAACGGTCLAGVLVSFVGIDAGTNLWIIRGAMFLSGACNSATFLPIQSAMFTTISVADTGHASAIYATQRQVSIAASVAVLTTIVASVHGSQQVAFHAAFVAAGAMALVGAIAAFILISTADARSSMVPASRGS